MFNLPQGDVGLARLFEQAHPAYDWLKDDWALLLDALDGDGQFRDGGYLWKFPREYDVNVSLCELDDWNCCGASSAHFLDEELAVRLPARNLRIAEQSGRELLVPCAACFQRLKHADKELRKDASRWIEAPYRGQTAIYHVNDFFDRPERTLGEGISTHGGYSEGDWHQDEKDEIEIIEQVAEIIKWIPDNVGKVVVAERGHANGLAVQRAGGDHRGVESYRIPDDHAVGSKIEGAVDDGSLPIGELDEGLLAALEAVAVDLVPEVLDQ